jgi:hypothetical protein
MKGSAYFPHPPFPPVRSFSFQAPEATWRRSPVAAAWWRICNRHACGFLQEATEIEEGEKIACLFFLGPFVRPHLAVAGSADVLVGTANGSASGKSRERQLVVISFAVPTAVYIPLYPCELVFIRGSISG